jgi:hypothetical protein
MPSSLSLFSVDHPHPDNYHTSLHIRRVSNITSVYIQDILDHDIGHAAYFVNRRLAACSRQKHRPENHRHNARFNYDDYL